MSKKRRLKKKSKAKIQNRSKPTLSSILKQWWIEKNPVLLFLGRFVLFLVFFHIIRYTAFYSDYVYPSLTHANAYFAHLILNLFGQHTTASNASIQSPLFTMSIVHGCDAIEAVMIYGSVVLAFPSSLTKRIIGAIVGSTFLIAINLFRVVSLFLIGVYFNDWFEFVHIELWQFIFILLALVTCMVWINWSLKDFKPVVP